MQYQYRQVYQMSSSQSPKLCPKSEDALQLDVKKSCSLPNIGNTCFLNSVIQVLFRLVIIKDFLLDYNGRNQLLLALKKLFQQIIDQASAEKKKKTLFSIQKHIQPQLLNYVSGRQYDSFETMLKFLDVIFEENRELQRLIDIQYTQKCICDGYQQFCQHYIESQPKRCSKCNQIISIKLKKLPECLIIKDLNKTEMHKDLSRALKDYNLVSKNIYKGTGRFGHYYAFTKFQKFYELNDERVIEIDQVMFERELCMFSIYQKKGHNHYKQKQPVENPEQINEENQGGLIEWVKKNPVKSAFIVAAFIGVCFGIGFGIDKANTSSSYGQSSNFETHHGLLADHEQDYLKTHIHSPKNLTNHKSNQSDSQLLKTEKYAQVKQKSCVNLRREEEQRGVQQKS